jgi:3-oxoacyl-[acyl-carrier protein] reductase
MTARPLAGAVAVVTGGGSGIGRATCLRLAADGAAVLVLDRDADAARAVSSEAAAAGGEAEPLVADVTDRDRLLAVLSDAEARRGRVDVLVNNAGVSGQRRALEDIPPDVLEGMLAVNVKAAVWAAQALVPGMKRRRAGAIVNMSSVFALKGSAFASHYAAAKGALLGLTRAWALELAPWGVRANAVAPGLVSTPLTRANNPPEWFDSFARGVPMGRLGTPEDIAAAVAWLAGPDAAFMTGQVLSPNGGDAIF